MLRNTDQNDKQNTNRASGNIPIFNNILDILKSLLFENEYGALW